MFYIVNFLFFFYKMEDKLYPTVIFFEENYSHNKIHVIEHIISNKLFKEKIYLSNALCFKNALLFYGKDRISKNKIKEILKSIKKSDFIESKKQINLEYQNYFNKRTKISNKIISYYREESSRSLDTIYFDKIKSDLKSSVIKKIVQKEDVSKINSSNYLLCYKKKNFSNKILGKKTYLLDFSKNPKDFFLFFFLDKSILKDYLGLKFDMNSDLFSLTTTIQTSLNPKKFFSKFKNEIRSIDLKEMFPLLKLVYYEENRFHTESNLIRFFYKLHNISELDFQNLNKKIKSLEPEKDLKLTFGVDKDD